MVANVPFQALRQRVVCQIAQGFQKILVVLGVDEAAGDDIRAGEDGAVLGREVDHDHDHPVLGQMLAVAQDHAAHVAHAGSVHKDPSRRDDGPGELAGLGGQLDDLAHVPDHDAGRAHAHLPGQLRMDLQHPLLAVDRDEEPGLDQGVDQLELLLAGVAGDVQTLGLVVDDLSALAVELVDDPGDGLFVAGDRGGGDQHAVEGGDLHLFVGGEGHAVEGGHILALGAGGHDDQTVRGDGPDLGDVHQRILRDGQIAQLARDLEDVFHAPARDRHLASVPPRQVQNGLDAVHVRGEGRDDDPLVAAAELTVEVLSHQIFRGRVAGALDVRGVAEQGQNALVAQLAQTGEIGHPVRGGGVDLEVAGDDDPAHGRVDAEGDGVGNGMVHVDEFHGEAACLDQIAGLVGDQTDRVGQTVLLQLEADQTVGQGRAVDRRVGGLEDVGDGPDVILMAVGNEEAAQLLLTVDEIGDVGDDQIDAVHIVLGEAQTAVHDDHIVAVFEHGHILPDLIQPAERDDA